MKKKKPVPMDVDLQVKCTGIELSPDKRETIYVKFEVYDRNKARTRIDRIEFPRITVRDEMNPDTGEKVERKVNAFHNGHFTAVFERKAAMAAVDRFFPDYKEDIASYIHLRSIVNATTERISMKPETLSDEIIDLREKLDKFSAMSLDQEGVWKMYLSVIRTIHKFGRENGDNI